MGRRCAGSNVSMTTWPLEMKRVLNPRVFTNRQYAIQNGASFTYEWTARQYGQYWYVFSDRYTLI
jgi:hypothetical protein